MKEKLPPNPADIHGPNAGEPGYDAIKKGINESGEDLYIGTREEIDRAKAKAESEGRAPDLASYIRLHKKIGVPKDAIATVSEYFESFLTGQAELFEATDGENVKLYYKDAEGNLAVVLIDEKLIDSKPKEGLVVQLQALGFHIGPKLFRGAHPSAVVASYARGLVAIEQEDTRKKFSF